MDDSDTGSRTSVTGWFLQVICIVMLLCGIVGVPGYAAEYLLEIDGPDTGFEGEVVVFTVLLNGEPVQARVVFGGQNSTFTDGVTGEVSFVMPKVPFVGKSFVIEAWVAGNISAEYSIMVKNLTGSLSGEYSVEEVEELDNFSVNVVANDQPIEDAEVWFNSEVYTTKADGVVYLQAPDVLVTTNFGISIKKEGYGSFVDTVRVYEAGQGIQFMEVLGPRIVNPGSVNLSYLVVGLTGGLDQVSVSVIYEDVEVGSYVSDGDGVVLVDAPSSINQDYFTVQFSKQGFSFFSGENEVIVYLFEEILGPSLILDLVPSEVNEGEMVRAEVLDSNGQVVDDVSVWLGGSPISSVTDDFGMVEFRSPVVFFDQEQYVYAVKEGFNLGESKLTIRNNPLSTPSLFIKVNSVVNESSSFVVRVVDGDDNPVNAVEVWFDGDHVMTNDSGSTWLTAPSVDGTTVFMINASRDGFLPSSAMVEVAAVTGTGDGSDVLVIGVVPSILEGKRFVVSVRTVQGNVVSGARVSFQDTFYYTDFTGTVEIIAPEVSWDSTETIIVSRVGYLSAQFDVVIKNVEGFPYWFLVGIIVVVLVVGITMYYRNRYRF